MPDPLEIGTAGEDGVMTFDREQFRIAVFDIDGTIFDRGMMQEEVADAIRRLAASGVQTVIATGRHPFNLPKQVNDIESIRYVIGLNGGMVADRQSREIFSMITMDVESARATVREMYNASPLLHVVYEEYGDITEEDLNVLLQKYPNPEHRAKADRELRNVYRVTSTVEELLDGIVHPMIKAGVRFRSPEETEAGAKKLRSLLDNEVVITDNNMVEVTPRGVSKARGLEELCVRLGCTPENTVAFGDSGNDVNIMQRAGFSVAMGNAMDEVKAIADYVTDTVQNAGVAKAIHALWGV